MGAIKPLSDRAGLLRRISLTLLLVAGLFYCLWAMNPGNKISAQTSQEAYFLLREVIRNYYFVIRVTDPVGIQQARDILDGKPDNPAINGATWATGLLVPGNACYNSPWRFHLDPQTIRFAQVTIEACQASMHYVEDNYPDFQGTRVCLGA